MAFSETSVPPAFKARYEDAALRLAELAKNFELEPPQVTPPSPGRPEKYEYIGETLYQKFRQQTPDSRFHSGGAIHGFCVAARLAMWGTRAYEEFVRQRHTGATIEELQAILAASYRPAVTTFSSVGNERNKVLEQAFGLGSSYLPGYEDLPFTIISDGRTVSPVLTPSPSSFYLAARELEYGLDRELPTVGRCPASGGMLKNIWRLTIATCAENQDFFPFDVEQINGRLERPE